MTRPETAETRARRRQRAIMLACRRGFDAAAQSTVIKMRCREHRPQIYSFLNTITVLLKYENAAAFLSAHSASRSLT